MGTGPGVSVEEARRVVWAVGNGGGELSTKDERGTLHSEKIRNFFFYKYIKSTKGKPEIDLLTRRREEGVQI